MKFQTSFAKIGHDATEKSSLEQIELLHNCSMALFFLIDPKNHIILCAIH